MKLQVKYCSIQEFVFESFPGHKSVEKQVVSESPV